MTYEETIEYRGVDVEIVMNSGAKYVGLYAYGNPKGGGQITLSKLCICQKSGWWIRPKRSIARKFWVSKIKSMNTYVYVENKDITIVE